MSFSMLPPLVEVSTRTTTGMMAKAGSLRYKAPDSPIKGIPDIQSVSRAEKSDTIRSFTELQDKHDHDFDQLSENFAVSERMLQEEIMRSKNYSQRVQTLERDAKRLTEGFERRGEELAKAEAKLRNHQSLEKVLLAERERAAASALAAKGLHEQLGSAAEKLRGVAVLESRVKELEHGLKESALLLAKSTADGNRLSERCTKLEDELAITRQQNSRAQGKVVDEKQKIAHLEREASSLARQRDALQALLSTTKNDTIQARESLKDEKHKFQLENKDLQAKLNASEAEKTVFERQVQQLTLSLSKLQAETQEKQQGLNAQIEALKSMEEKEQAASMERVRLEEELSRMAQQNVDLCRQLGVARTEVSELGKGNELAQVPNKEVDAELRAKEAECVRLTAELEAVRAGLTGDLRQLENELIQAKRTTEVQLEHNRRAEEEWKKEQQAMEARDRGKDAETGRLMGELERASVIQRKFENQLRRLERELGEVKQQKKEEQDHQAAAEEERERRKQLEQRLQARGFEVGRLEKEKIELKHNLEKLKVEQENITTEANQKLDHTIKNLSAHKKKLADMGEALEMAKLREESAANAMAKVMLELEQGREREQELRCEVERLREEGERGQNQLDRSGGVTEQLQAEVDRLAKAVGEREQGLREMEAEKQRVEGLLSAKECELETRRREEEQASKDLEGLRAMAGRVGEVELRLEKKEKQIQRTDCIITKLMSDIDKVKQHAVQNGLLEKLPFLIS